MNPRVVFVHIPKTAGIAVHEALEQWAGREATLRYNLGGVDDWARHRRLTDDEITPYRLISGHLGFLAYADDPRFVDWLFVTVLREPISRVLSLYNYVKGSTVHPWHAQLAQADLDSFLDFVEREGNTMDGQCLMVSGSADAAKSFDTLRSRYFLAATVEALPLMMDLLSVRLGTRLTVGRSNESKTRTDPSEVSQPTLERIQALNAQDIALYERVLQAGLIGVGVSKDLGT